MKKKSETRKKQEPDFRAVYAEVDRRSNGWCEVRLQGERIVFPCSRRGEDHHHTIKPRAANTTPEQVIHICRIHHNRCDWPYNRGRLEILPNGDGTFRCAIVTAPDKFTYRTQGGQP